MGGLTHPARVWPDVVWDVSYGRDKVPKRVLKAGLWGTQRVGQARGREKRNTRRGRG